MGEIGEFSRALKAQRKRQKAAHPPRRRCYDWMIVSGYGHYAKNRSSFTDYRRIRGTAQGSRVIGIGTVKLQVLRSPGAPDMHTVLLENVLHIPDAICNGFKSDQLGGEESRKAGLLQVRDSSTGQPLWYGVEFCGLRRLALAGNPQGESVLEEKTRAGCALMLSMYLSAKEMENLLPKYLAENS